MKLAEAFVGIAVMLGVLGCVFAFVMAPVFLAGSAWRQAHYVRHGKCPKCHRVGSWQTYSTDQLYGTAAKVLVCPTHGPVGGPSGDRRFADW
jgi:hypothetical protein